MKKNEADHALLRRYACRLRHHIITMNCHAGSGHPGGSLSAVELVTWLFFHEMDLAPDTLQRPDHDRFILSKGHACLVLYAALAEKGFFSTEEFKSLRHAGGMLQGHPDRLKTPGVEFNSGSLGQGFSFALGCALGAKRRRFTGRVHVLLGDGEMNEGQVWEAMMFGAHHRLDNLLAIIDANGFQSDDRCGNITALEPLADKCRAFGWHVQEIDGHDFTAIGAACAKAKETKGRPSIIVARTVKGKGVSFMENNPKWHGSLCPTGQEKTLALEQCPLPATP